MQFLMGLDDTYIQPRSQLLLTSNLPDLSGAYSLLLQDEAQRSHTHPPVSTDRAALQSNVNDINASFNTSQALMAHPMSIRNRPRCKHCGNLGHTEDKCYKLHGYPPGHRHYRKGNTHRASSSLSSSNPPKDSKDVLSNNQSLQQLLRLLQEVNQPKANLAGEFFALNSSLCKPNE